MNRIVPIAIAALGLAITAGCEQEGYVPDERVEGEGVGPEDGRSPALEAPVADGEVDVGNGASGEIPTEGGGFTED